MKTNICPVCAIVSSVWLVLSVGVAWGIFMSSIWLIPIALLMGGSVVGIANKLSSPRWKVLTLIIGMPLAYLAVTYLNKPVVLTELVIMLGIAFLLFVKRSGGNEKSEEVRKIEEQMKQCC